jgi:hypothetical protein
VLRIGVTLALALAGCRDVREHDTVDARPSDARPDVLDPEDGAPIRLPCTNQLGSALSPGYGRLDGILVAIVPPRSGGCNADTSHVHLQVQLADAVYDIAVNIDADVLSARREVAVDTTPWAEGWHTALRFDYADAGIHADDFTSATPAQLASELIAELEAVNHISIYGTGYSESGAHLIHRNNGLDGALVTRPLSSPPRVRMYRFSNQTF